MSQKAMPLSIIDRTLSWIAPRAAMKRHAARMMLQVMEGRREFDAVSGSRLRSDWTNITRDADSANVAGLEALRNNVRNLACNSGIVSGPLKRVTNNVIGSGIRPQARVKADGPYDSADPTKAITQEAAERFNYQAEKLWKPWSRKASSDLQLDIYEQQALAFRGMFGDGETLVVCRSSSFPGRPLPLCIENIEIDRLRTPPGEINNPQIRNGVIFDDEGIPVKYIVLKRHPGSTTVLSKNMNDYEELSAFSSTGTRQVFHLFDILRPGQSRGYTPFAAGLTDIQDLKRYQEAEVIAARIAACLAAFVRSPADYAMWLQQGTDGKRIKEFEPGMVEYLKPGEEVEVFSANRPNTAMGAFSKLLMMSAANAVDVPYEVFANDWSGLNYSNARTVLLQAQIGFRMYQNYMIKHFCAPVWENFIVDGIIAGKLDAPGFDLRRDDYLQSAWIAQGWNWVDPVKEVDGKTKELDSMLDTLTNILAGTKGADFDETIEARAIELKKIKEMEMKYGVKLTQDKTSQKTGDDTDEDNPPRPPGE